MKFVYAVSSQYLETSTPPSDTVANSQERARGKVRKAKEAKTERKARAAENAMAEDKENHDKSRVGRATKAAQEALAEEDASAW